MANSVERAERYRLRAEEIRILAESFQESFARDGMEDVARQYDALADRLEGFHVVEASKVLKH